MATFADVERIACGLPEVTEGTRWGNHTWFVAKKSFAWERPLNKADIKRWVDGPLPEGPILGVRAEDLDEREALLQAHGACCFSIQHFDNYPALLVRLDVASLAVVRELLTNAYLAVAPARLAREVLDGSPPG